MSDTIRVFILDDHPGMIDGYRYRLSQSPEIQVVGSARYGSEVLPSLAEQPADAVILDIGVPAAPDNPNPYPIHHLIPQILQAHPNTAIVVITMHLERSLVRAVMEAGASGYILKEDVESQEKLARVIRLVAEGGIYLSDKARELWTKTQPAAADSLLTPRQREALSLSAAYPDHSTAQLADLLSVAPSTLRNLLSGAYLRLGVSTRAAAIEKSRQLGLLIRSQHPL